MKSIRTYINESLTTSRRGDATERIRTDARIGWLLNTVQLNVMNQGVKDDLQRFFGDILVEGGDGWVLDFDLTPGSRTFGKKYPAIKRFLSNATGLYMNFLMETLPPADLKLNMTDKCPFGFDINVEFGGGLTMNPATCKKISNFLNGVPTSSVDAFTNGRPGAATIDGLDVARGYRGIYIGLPEGTAAIKNLIIREPSATLAPWRYAPEIQVAGGDIYSTGNIRIEARDFEYWLHFKDHDTYKKAFECLLDNNEVDLPEGAKMPGRQQECKVVEGGFLYNMLENAICADAKGVETNLRISNPGAGGAYDGWIIFERDNRGKWIFKDGDLREP